MAESRSAGESGHAEVWDGEEFLPRRPGPLPGDRRKEKVSSSTARRAESGGSIPERSFQFASVVPSKEVMGYETAHPRVVRANRRRHAGLRGLRRIVLLQHKRPRREDGDGDAAELGRQDRDRGGR